MRKARKAVYHANLAEAHALKAILQASEWSESIETKIRSFAESAVSVFPDPRRIQNCPNHLDLGAQIFEKDLIHPTRQVFYYRVSENYRVNPYETACYLAPPREGCRARSNE